MTEAPHNSTRGTAGSAGAVSRPPAAVGEREIQRAIRCSYAQTMLGAIYAASTGGMFIIGYALKLGADNVDIGLMSTAPMFCVLAQLAAAWIVERGVSRRRLTIVFSLLNVLCWVLIILVPYLGRAGGPEEPHVPSGQAQLQIRLLIGIIMSVAIFGHVAGNSRGSWFGDLIPAGQRGTFFGKATMLGGLIGTVFALAEGAFLDRVKTLGIGAFSWLFAFGMLFGLANALLFLPQPDMPLQRDEPARRRPFASQVIATFRNRPLMILTLCWLLWIMQSMAWPFYPTYMIRDLGMPFLGIGLTTAASTITTILAARFWGRMVNRLGCRPVLVTCMAAQFALPLCWIWMTSPARVYAVVIPLNVLAGFVGAGIIVAIQTMVYKVTPQTSRSVQLAVWAVLVVAVPAIMPTFGGKLPELLARWGWAADLRVVFVSSVFFGLLSTLAARHIVEPEARAPGLLLATLRRRLPWAGPRRHERRTTPNQRPTEKHV